MAKYGIRIEAPQPPLMHVSFDTQYHIKSPPPRFALQTEGRSLSPVLPVPPRLFYTFAPPLFFCTWSAGSSLPYKYDRQCLRGLVRQCWGAYHTLSSLFNQPEKQGPYPMLPHHMGFLLLSFWVYILLADLS